MQADLRGTLPRSETWQAGWLETGADTAEGDNT
jgi:hypothetical protein